MAWAKPLYSRDKINLAGNLLIGNPAPGLSVDLAFDIINNWRASHNFPLNTFQTRLRRIAKSVDSNCIVAQRIKRLSSIEHKLQRFPKMKLSQIQDIGGCRAILSTVKDVDELVKLYVQQSRGVKHALEKETNYILKPPISGYRGVHLIYKYKSDKNQDYENLKIEIQIRTFLQHAWATAVETVSTFFRQALKSSQGDEDWLRFFKLMGSVMAIQENRPLIPETPVKYNILRREIVSLERKLNVIAHLQTFRDSLSVFDEERDIKEAHYYLLELDVSSRRILIRSYQQNELTKASEDYLTAERKNTSNFLLDTVLVSADSLEKLKLAYPNYYLDTDLFLQCVRDVIKRRSHAFFEPTFRQGEFHFK